jgi:hypothetical protein
MDGAVHTWDEFLRPETDELERLPRRSLKAGRDDVRKRLEKDIQSFCENNFVHMTEEKLVNLYEEVKILRGLEMPLEEFEQKFSKFKPSAIAGNPPHSTVHISLWGLGFEFPEKYLADDIEASLLNAQKYKTALSKYEKLEHYENINSKGEIALCVKHLKYNSRAALFSCFNLVEAYFNSIAWEFASQNGASSSLSKKQADLLRDGSGTSLRDKIIKYPKIITGNQIFTCNLDPAKSFLEIVKPYRDSLVHPSPFSAPERFGGYDKLRLMYRIDLDTAIMAAHQSVTIITETHRVINSHQELYPNWLKSLVKMIENAQA